MRGAAACHEGAACGPHDLFLADLFVVPRPPTNVALCAGIFKSCHLEMASSHRSIMAMLARGTHAEVKHAQQAAAHYSSYISFASPSRYASSLARNGPHGSTTPVSVQHEHQVGRRG